jgi:hypothetical protein
MGGTADVVNVAQLRERLRKMTDRQPREWGNEFVIQLEEATWEWRRRKNPKTENTK